MKSAIEELYFGTFMYETIKLSPKQQKCLDDIIECDNALRTLFQDNKEAGDYFARFKCALDENTAAEALACYKEGFRNGFQIALDAMGED